MTVPLHLKGVPARLPESSTTRAEGCGSTGHLVALVDQLRDEAKERATRCALIELNVCSCQALNDDVHDLGNDVANVGVL